MYACVYVPFGKYIRAARRGEDSSVARESHQHTRRVNKTSVSVTKFQPNTLFAPYTLHITWGLSRDKASLVRGFSQSDK